MAELDSPNADYGSKAARLLKIMRQKGYQTAVDLVSVNEPDRFKSTVLPALKYVDYLIVNELEATGLTDIEIRGRDKKLTIDNMAQAAQQLTTLGVNQLVTIHCPEGAYLVTAQGDGYLIPSWHVDHSEIRGSVGVGDTFCAGLLYALHEGMPYEQALKLANAAARFNLLSCTSIGGAASVNELEDFMRSAKLGADWIT